MTSTPADPNCCCSKGSAPYWSNPLFLIFDIRALWRSVLSARAPECQKLKTVGQTSVAKCKALTGSAMKGLEKELSHFVTSEIFCQDHQLAILFLSYPLNDHVLYILHCSLHISRLPSALYRVRCLCFVTFNLLYSLYDFSTINNNRGCALCIRTLHGQIFTTKLLSI